MHHSLMVRWRPRCSSKLLPIKVLPGKILNPLTLTSDSDKFVLNSLTPQLMSKPTPPGDTILSGLSMSKAAMFPMANPYPLCTSGRPMDLPTMPGRAATLPICFMAGRNPPVPYTNPQLHKSFRLYLIH